MPGRRLMKIWFIYPLYFAYSMALQLASMDFSMTIVHIEMVGVYKAWI